MMRPFKSGDEVYTKDGYKCRFVQEMNGQYLVIPFLYEDRFGDPFFTSAIFAAPPMEQKHGEIATLDAEIKTKRKELQTIYEETRTAIKERDAMLTRLKEHEALKRIDDYLLGKFAYFVIFGYSKPKIVSAEQALADTECLWGGRTVVNGTKLLTLFGTDKDRFRKGRGLQWQRVFHRSLSRRIRSRGQRNHPATL